MKNFRAGNITFNTLAGADGEVYGVLSIDGEIKESGFYRTTNHEQAFQQALLNHFSFLESGKIFDKAVA